MSAVERGGAAQNKAYVWLMDLFAKSEWGLSGVVFLFILRMFYVDCYNLELYFVNILPCCHLL